VRFLISLFVEHRAADLFPHCRGSAVGSLDGTLEDGDLVWGDQVVAAGALGEGNALVEAEQGLGGAQPDPLELPRRGPPGDHHLHVLHSLLDLWRQFCQGLGHDLGEVEPVFFCMPRHSSVLHQGPDWLQADTILKVPVTCASDGHLG